jgi:acylphosphatase
MDQDPRSKSKRSSPADETVRAHVWVKGRVQGVGFRAHVEYSARQTGGLTGWVRNVGYDTVEAIAEGQRASVDRFIQRMKDGPRGSRVDEAKVEWEKPTGEFTQFGVRRSL